MARPPIRPLQSAGELLGRSVRGLVGGRSASLVLEIARDAEYELVFPALGGYRRPDPLRLDARGPEPERELIVSLEALPR